MSWLLYTMAAPPILIVFLRFISLILPGKLAQLASFAAFFITSMIMMSFSAMYGVFASIFLRTVGYGGLSQWTVARVFKWTMWYTTGVTFKVTNSGGEEALLTRPAVLLGNHQRKTPGKKRTPELTSYSELDVLMLGCTFPKYTSVTAKKSLKWAPILGWFMALSKTVFIDRANRTTARAAFDSAANTMRTERQNVFIFPEGTRSYAEQPELLPFKKGAFHLAIQAQVPIIAIVVANYSHVLNVKKREFHPGVIDVSVLPPISTKGMTAENVDALMKRTRDAMLDELIRLSHVTGEGNGINFSFAALLLAKGCNVLIADLSLRPEAQKLFSEYDGKGKPKAVFVKTDVTDWTQLERMFDVARKEFGTVDVVCPGAGISKDDPHWTNFWHPPGSTKSKDSPTSSRYATLDINITHPIRTTQLAISQYLSDKASPRNPKRVVIISSIAGQASNLNTPLYVAAKHAMNGFIRSLGPLDARLGIRVNGVAPGVIKTPLWTEHPEKMSFLDEKQDTWATPEEVAEAMLRCVEEEGLGGGTVLEVGAGQTRRVEQFNDPGPSGRGHTVTNLERSYEEVFGWLGEEGWGKRKAKL
ncbi:hypothetical protein SLS60_003656 [Paraconiothyrium brasiliense]|uniref:1-acyl-sn-glycerol-3-phosphate acyltransferase n=1 Tax=Paraconiothyrium brasiliense TaxID=300254 RepID=A0ABR3RQ48_9PLEO